MDKLEGEMLQRNWCVRRSSKLMSISDIIEAYLVSRLDSHDDRRHEDCTELRCEQQLRADKNMQLNHDEANCNGLCNEVTFEDTEIIRTLEHKGIPGIRQNLSGGGNPEYYP